MASDLAALEKGLCTPDEAETCREENGADPEWACAHCPKKRSGDLSPYTLKLLDLYSLQRAGYPFRANDMEYQEWLDLGQIRQVLEDRQTTCPFTG